jgi:hypothetical protein
MIRQFRLAWGVASLSAVVGTSERIEAQSIDWTSWPRTEAAIYWAGITDVRRDPSAVAVVDSMFWWPMVDLPRPSSPIGPVAKGSLTRTAPDGYRISFHSWNDVFADDGSLRLSGSVFVLGPIDFLGEDTAMFRMTVSGHIRDQILYRVLCRLIDGAWVVVDRGVERLT